MTPDVQAAADRITAYLHLTEAPDRISTDLHALLAELDRLGEPCDGERCETGGALHCHRCADYENDKLMRTSNELRGQLREAVTERDIWKERALQLNAALDPADQPADRHQPLTDEPCGHVPTDRGRQAVLDYHAIRQQQHPRGADQ